jgi:hypothetical protein
MEDVRGGRWCGIGDQKVEAEGTAGDGVGQAIDVQIHNITTGKVLGAANPGRWRSTRWATKLAAAVRPSAHFTGPLLLPDEPWHWTFDPSP